MTEKRRYVIEKHLEPEQLGAAYADSLETLPGDETDLTSELPLILKKREMTPQEAETVNARAHIRAVHEDTELSVDEPEVSPDAISCTMRQVRRYHGFNVAHKKRWRAQGRKICILDTGLDATWAERLGDRLIHKESYVEGEDWRDTNSGHGTHVTGTIAMAARRSELMVYKVLSTRNGSGYMSDSIAAINDAVKRGATDINMSLGGEGSPSSPVCLAVNAAREKGVLFGIAAGNEQRGTNAMTADSHAPGCATGATTTACQDISGNLSDFSSWGNCVDIRAVGEAQQSWAIGGGYKHLSGTSMAAPVVTAAQAVCGSFGAEADAIQKAIYSSCGDTRLAPFHEGHGILDIEYAVKRLLRSGREPDEECGCECEGGK